MADMNLVSFIPLILLFIDLTDPQIFVRGWGWSERVMELGPCVVKHEFKRLKATNFDKIYSVRRKAPSA